MNSMVVGISPEYNYPGNWDKWESDNTYYASNLGASLIVRSIMKEFNADYIDDFSNISNLKNKYDTCFLGLATHAHASRDISRIVSLLEKLDMKVVVLSLGMSDYLTNTQSNYKLHPSVLKLLKIASEGTNWIGVRGPYTASILYKNGIKNVVPIGCPTVYSNQSREFKIKIKESYESPLVVYHRAIAEKAFRVIQGIPLLGQDYEDESFFSDVYKADFKLRNKINAFYKGLDNSPDEIQSLRRQGIFLNRFSDWDKYFSNHDFVFGPRLHGCIAALLKGIPAILTPRDLRVKEIAEFFDLPYISLDKLSQYSKEEIYKHADFTSFTDTFRFRYDNYISFINENGLDSSFELIKTRQPSEFKYSVKDVQTFHSIIHTNIIDLNNMYEKFASKTRYFKLSYYKGMVHKFIKKLRLV